MNSSLPLVLAGSLVMLSAATSQAVGAPVVEVAPRTPLYCEDGSHAIQPLIYGDFGDLVAAYRRLHGWPGAVTAQGDGFALTFVAPPTDADSAGEVVTFALTRHEDGYAVRYVTDKPKGLKEMRLDGTIMCARILQMFAESDPQRALAFRKAWGEKHPDSTSR